MNKHQENILKKWLDKHPLCKTSFMASCAIFLSQKKMTLIEFIKIGIDYEKTLTK